MQTNIPLLLPRRRHAGLLDAEESYSISTAIDTEYLKKAPHSTRPFPPVFCPFFWILTIILGSVTGALFSKLNNPFGEESAELSHIQMIAD